MATETFSLGDETSPNSLLLEDGTLTLREHQFGEVYISGTGVVGEGTISGSAQTLAYPSGMAVGDLAIAYMSILNLAVPAAQTGWTSQCRHSRVTDTALPNLYVGTRVIDGSESATHNFTSLTNNIFIGQIIVLRNANTTPTIQYTESTSTTTPAFAGVTTSAANHLVFLFTAANGTNIDISTAPTNPTNLHVLSRRSQMFTRSGFSFANRWTGSGATGNVVPTWNVGNIALGLVMSIAPA